MIYIKKFFLFVFITIIILCGVLVFLFGTNTGTHLIFMGIAYYIPGLNFESVSGRWGNFKCIHVMYKIPTGGVIKVSRCNILINLKYVFFKRIYIQRLFIEDMFINVNVLHLINKKIEHIKNNNLFDNFIKNYLIFFKDIKLNKVCITSNNFEIQLQELNTGVMLQNNLLKILPVYICEGSFVYRPVKQDFLNNNFNYIVYPTYWVKNLSFTKRILKNFIDNSFLSIKKYFLFKDFILTNVQGKKIRICYGYNKWNLINEFQLQAYYVKSVAHMELFVDSSHGYFTSIGNITCKDCYPVCITANYIDRNDFIQMKISDNTKEDLARIKLIITGSLMNELCIDYNFLRVASSIHIITQVELMRVNIPIKLSIVGSRFPIFLLNKNQCIIEKFNFYLHGDQNNYSICMQSKLNCSNSTESYIFMNAHGNKYNFTISKLKIKVLDGFCEIKGDLSWKDKITWHTTLVVNGINFFQKYLEYPMKLSGKIVMQGYIYSDSWEAMISYFNLYGKYNQFPITCQGSAHIDPDGRWYISMFNINWGSNVLKISGEIASNRVFNIILQLCITNASDLSSDLCGQLYGFLKLYGSLDSLSMLLKINAYSLEWRRKNINVKNIRINGNFHNNNLMQSNIDVVADQVKYKDFLFSIFRIQGQGNILSHCFDIMIRGHELFGDLKLVGQFNSENNVWTGKINKTNILTPIGDWNLIEDIVFIYRCVSREIILKAHCWESNCCKLHNFNIVQKNFFKSVKSIFERFNYASLSFVPVEIINIYNMRVYCGNIHWILGNTFPIGFILISGERLSIKTINANIVPIYLNNLILRIVLTSTDCFVDGTCLINNNKNYGKFCITNFFSIPKISGTIQCKNIDLSSIFQVLFQPKEIMQGLLDINLNIQGFLYNPRLYGFVILKNYNFNCQYPSLYIQNSMLKIEFLGNSAILNGIINTKYSDQLYLNGKIINFCSIKNVNFLLQVQGNCIHIPVSSNILLKVSPKIICRINKGTVDIQGNIDIPWAQIKLKEFANNTVTIVSDEIILDDQFRPVINEFNHKLRMFTISKLIVSFGHDVNMNGFGLEVKLQGNLEISYNNNDLSIIGQIKTSSGYFRMYGIDLMIKQGQLLFSGPIHQAYLDIEAIKKTSVRSSMQDCVIVGVRITGILDHLRLDLFSNEVSFSQQEIATYLLGDYNLILSHMHNTNERITSLLIGMSIKKYEKLVNKIGKTLGIQHLILNTQDFGNKSLVALSGYIIPGLQIKYGINIFDLLTEVTVRYCINQNLCLEVISSGCEQTVDLLCKFDF